MTADNAYVFNDVGGERPMLMRRLRGDLTGVRTEPDGRTEVMTLELTSGDMSLRVEGLWFPERREAQRRLQSWVQTRLRDDSAAEGG